MPSFVIADRWIGDEHPPLVIAEIGINHGGDLAVAKEMVLSAKRAGAEIIKHQTHIIEDEMSGQAKSVVPGNATISIYEIMKSCALTLEEERALKAYTQSLGLIYLSTPFSRAAADFLEEEGVPAFKIGSGECNNIPLIDHICKFGKPIILSTGMNTIESVRATVEVIRSHGVPYALLHCTNLYPTPHRLVRYGAMRELQTAFPDAVIGLSDHTLNNNACLGAVALGASILERHYTDHKQRLGPDIICSMDEADLADLIIGSQEVFLCRGGSKDLLEEEEVTRNFAFSTVVAIKDIQPGETLNEKNIWVKRPGTGEIFAKDYTELLGRKAANFISNDTHLSWKDLQE